MQPVRPWALVFLVVHRLDPLQGFEFRSHIPNFDFPDGSIEPRRSPEAPCELSTAPPVMWTATRDDLPTVYLAGTIKVAVGLVQPLPPVFDQVLSITQDGGLWVERVSEHRNDPQYHLYLLWKCHTYPAPKGASKIKTRLAPQRFKLLLQHSRAIAATLKEPFRSNVLGLANMAQNGMAALSYYHDGQLESYHLNVLSYIFIVEENRKANARPRSYQPQISVFKGERADQLISEFLANQSARVSSLETFEDQCTVYRDRTAEQESLAVKEWAQEHVGDGVNSSSVPLGITSWRCGNISMLGGDGSLQTIGEIEWFKDHVAAQRNAKMAQGIQVAHAATKYPILVAIGTSHLAYNSSACLSVLELLRRSGYQIKRLTDPDDVNSSNGEDNFSWVDILLIVLAVVVALAANICCCLWCLHKKPFRSFSIKNLSQRSRTQQFHMVSKTNLLDAEGAAPGDSVKLAAQHALLIADIDDSAPEASPSLL